MRLRSSRLAALARSAPLLAALCAVAHAAAAVPSDFERARAIAREQERLARVQTLWPGYDPIAIPLAIYTGEHTYLFRHPKPPDRFAPVAGAEPVAFVFDGRHEAVTSNTSADLGGTVTATLLADAERAKQPAAELAAVAIHEAFHVYQRAHHPTWQGNEGDLMLYPFTDARLLALRRLEEAALERALSARDPAMTACWARRALDDRRDRFARMDSAFVTYERRTELNEGLATYLQLRALGKRTVDFRKAGFGATEVRLRAYTVGPALALLLDRLQPSWRQSLESDDGQNIDEILSAATATATGDPCAIEAAEASAIDVRAVADARAVVTERAAQRKAFDARPGWRVVVDAEDGHPLWPQGFDPLNVSVVDVGLLHTRFIRLGNDAGQLSAIDEAGSDLEALTEGAGAHPLFNGVRRAVVAGLSKPEVERANGRTTLRAPGFSADFANAQVTESGTTVVITLGPSPAPR